MEVTKCEEFPVEEYLEETDYASPEYDTGWKDL
jgi:hypothetical protein